jgi:methanogenic corrinoid protein MtbC1
MWLEDRCSFADVTVGLCGLQKLLRGFGRLTGGAQARHDGNLALFAAVPGEQHTFGVMMLDCFFRQAGWQVVSMPLCSAGEVLSELSERHYLLAGFSVACEAQLEPLASLIRAARSASRNTSLIVMAGGRLFNEDPGLVHVVGADLTAGDGQQAVIATQHVLWSTEQSY